MSQTHKVAVIVGSLRQASLSRKAAHALARLAPDTLALEIVEIGDLPLYDEDREGEAAPAAWGRFREQVKSADAVLFVTPEYNRSIPGALKNAIDWASRPWGQNSFDNMPAAVIGASSGQIGTAMAQQSLRGVLSFCNARQMTAPEAYIKYSPELFTDDGEVTNDSTRDFLRDYMIEFYTYIVRVLTVLPRP